MKIRWLGKTDKIFGLEHNKIYQVLSIEKDWFRVVDDNGDDYLYPPQFCEVVEE